MTSKFCIRCGRELATGKRFCSGCGTAVPEAGATADEELRPALESLVVPPVAPVACVQCGTRLSPGKRFCRFCGLEVEPAEVPPPSDAPCFVQSPQSAETVEIPALPASDSKPAPPWEVPPSPPVSPWRDVSQTASGQFAQQQTPPTSPQDTVEIHTWPPVQEIPQSPAPIDPRPAWKLPLLAAAALSLACGAGWAWYARVHPCDSCGPKQVLGIPQPAAVDQPQPDPSKTPIQPEPQPKPAPGTAAKLPPAAHREVPQIPPQPIHPPETVQPPVPLPEPPRRIVLPPTADAGNGNPAAPTPNFHLPVKPPEPGHTGVLHYSGPPVPFGGSVVFENLPRARLKFTFDRNAWVLTLKINPDGSKRAILTSLRQSLQAQCDLGWEIVE